MNELQTYLGDYISQEIRKINLNPDIKDPKDPMQPKRLVSDSNIVSGSNTGGSLNLPRINYTLISADSLAESFDGSSEDVYNYIVMLTSEVSVGDRVNLHLMNAFSGSRNINVKNPDDAFWVTFSRSLESMDIDPDLSVQGDLIRNYIISVQLIP